MKYPARFPIAEPSRFRLGGSQDNVAVPFPCDDRLDGVGARRVHAHRIKRAAVKQIVARVATVRWVELMMVCPGNVAALTSSPDVHCLAVCVASSCSPLPTQALNRLWRRAGVIGQRSVLLGCLPGSFRASIASVDSPPLSFYRACADTW